MERIVDKAIVFACCAPVLVLTGTGFGSVAALLAAAACAFASELLPPRGRAALAVAYCALACAVPAGAVFVAPSVYDLVRRTSALALVAAVPVLFAVGTDALAPATTACALIPCVIAAALSIRTDSTLTARRRNLDAADALRERELTLERRNRELMDAQDYEVRLATLTERARIAREIHDNVGHLLTRATVQTEALRVVHAGEPVAGELAGVADTLREALAEVRTSVHDLRDDAADLSVQVRAVVECACAGTALKSAVHVEAGEAPGPVAACLTAVVREAVSNTLRHAHATHITVELVEHPGLWRLTVTDDGTGSDAAPAPGAGMGLASMEERVRALGGTFRVGPGTHGWTVFASVPKTEGSAP